MSKKKVVNFSFRLSQKISLLIIEKSTLNTKSKELRKSLKSKSDYGQVLHMPKDQAPTRNRAQEETGGGGGEEQDADIHPADKAAAAKITHAGHHHHHHHDHHHHMTVVDEDEEEEEEEEPAKRSTIISKSPIFAATATTKPADSAGGQQQLALFNNQQYALTQKKSSLLMPKPQWHAPWKLARVISGHLGWVRCIDVDPSNEWFVTGATDRIIKAWTQDKHVFCCFKRTLNCLIGVMIKKLFSAIRL